MKFSSMCFYTGDRIKYLLNTKIEYILYLIKQLAETSSKESKQKCLLPSFITSNNKDKQKKLNQLKCELDKDLSEICQAFQEHMRKVIIIHFLAQLHKLSITSPWTYWYHLLFRTIIVSLSHSLCTTTPKNFYHPNQLSIICENKSFNSWLTVLSVWLSRHTGLTLLISLFLCG